jgi:hypothetical protein
MDVLTYDIADPDDVFIPETSSDQLQFFVPLSELKVTKVTSSARTSEVTRLLCEIETLSVTNPGLEKFLDGALSADDLAMAVLTTGAELDTWDETFKMKNEQLADLTNLAQ